MVTWRWVLRLPYCSKRINSCQLPQWQMVTHDEHVDSNLLPLVLEVVDICAGHALRRIGQQPAQSTFATAGEAGVQSTSTSINARQRIAIFCPKLAVVGPQRTRVDPLSADVSKVRLQRCA